MLEGFATGFRDIIDVVNGTLVPLLFAVMFLVFLFNVFQYFIAGAAEDERRKQARQYAVYSVLGFVLLLSIWAIVNIVFLLFGIPQSTGEVIPSLL